MPLRPSSSSPSANPNRAEDLIVTRAPELDGRNYILLTALAETAHANTKPLSATLIWRALLNDILTRAYTKAYTHAATYLHNLRAAAPHITDYRGHPTHADYEQTLKARHPRKAAFGSRVPANP